MDQSELPNWVVNLEASDLQLIRRFVLASGSLKQLAADYDVSYPTIRLRIDSLIERLNVLDENADDDALEARIRLLVASGELDPGTGKDLMHLHRTTKGERK
jgi:hypothetical protein